MPYPHDNYPEIDYGDAEPDEENMTTKIRILITDQDGVLLDSAEVDIAKVAEAVEQARKVRGNGALPSHISLAAHEAHEMIEDEICAAIKRHGAK